jgi:exonuclease III
MRIVSWNMAYWSHRKHHDDAWRWVLDDLRPDVLLVQEAVVPEWVHQKLGVHWTRAYETGGQAWGTGIVTTYPFIPVRIAALDDWFRAVPRMVPGKSENAGIQQADGWFAAARITLPVVGDVFVGSVHSPSFPIEKSRLRELDVSAMKLKKNPDLWFLDVLFHFLRPMIGTKLIVGGDFNSSRLLDATLGERGNNEFFDRIRDEGFVSLHCLFHESDERTYFKAGKAPHQLDYLYADAPVAESCRGCTVRLDNMEYSDHAPLLCELGPE